MSDGVFIKYGEKEHLQQIIDGHLRFSPAKSYIEIEQKQHNKGQGDLLEGKWVIHTESVKMVSHQTGETFVLPPKSKITIGAVDVTTLSVFCLSSYADDIFDGNNSISLEKDDIERIKCDFPKATHALIIFEKNKFIECVKATIGHSVESDSIHYYDYDINDINMMSFLTTGDEDSYRAGVTLSMTYDERYRHLLCKDRSFSNQNEYRFIITDVLTDVPVSYDFIFDCTYKLLPIDELLDGVSVAE